ncbi:MAG: cation diffusion facilitator family transporter [Gemmatimonadetes bacterium]|nr:cation diffusion facilitator family transporter [Gemmatimonadota bacterium]
MSTPATPADCASLAQGRTGGSPSAHPHGGAPDGHDHHHQHAVATAGLKAALWMTLLFFFAELIGGVLANSLALLADAGHMFTDVGALGLSLFVAWFSRQPSTARKTFGYLRWEILAAFLNGSALLLVSAGIVWEAIGRLRHPEPIESGVMLVVATGGLVVNIIAARLLHAGAAHSLNVRGAYLHVLSDLLGSVAAIIAALAVRYMGWDLADPVASIVMTVLIVRGAWQLVRESVDVLLEAVPPHISLDQVRSAIAAVPGVASVHDLHVWTVTSGMVALSVHVVSPDPAQHQGALEQIHAAMARFGIGHVTVQIEGRALAECVPAVHS